MFRKFKMNKLDYVLDQELLQRILDYIGSSRSDYQSVKVITLIDEIRALRPFDPNTEKVPNEHLLTQQKILVESNSEKGEG